MLFSTTIAASTEGEFSGDSALVTLRTLSVDIGPRPMGSPAEHEAMMFAVDRLRQSGCQEAYIMPMAAADGVNTRSGVAIGVSRGRKDRIIIIGGHIDSAGPDIPGANDDGSGVACVLELARVLCKEPHQSTIMFCCWGGEERGLEGSKHFVEHFDRLDSVDLMLQIDMADGASILEIDPDYAETSAPRWLVEAAYQVFYDELHLSGLVYPVASSTLNAATGGSTGSDHDPFLEKGIPAIDFTSDVDYPIHTPQDNLENFQPSGLKRSGDLVLHLVRKFDSGIPSRATERYMLLQMGTLPLFFPQWVLWMFIAVSLILGALSIAVLKKRRAPFEEVPRVRWSVLKLLISTIIIQTFIWSSETVLGFIKGYRFAWVNNFKGFAVLGLLCGLVGLWLVLKSLRRFRLNADAFVFGWRAMTVFAIFTALAALRGPELAAFFGLAVMLMSFAFIVRLPGVRVLFWTLSGLVLLRLVFFEELGLIQRSMAANKIHSLAGLASYHATYVVLFTLLSLPFVLGFAAIYRASGRDVLWLKKYRSGVGLIVVAACAICLSVYLLLQPVYNARWYNNVVVEQRFDFGADSSKIEFKSSEYLEGTIMRSGNWQMMFTGRTNYNRFTPRESSVVRWASLERRVDTTEGKGDSVVVFRNVRLHSRLRPYTFTISYRSTLPFTVVSQSTHGGNLRLGRESDKLKVFSWYCFPDTNLDVPITFGLVKDQRVVEKVEVTYDSLAYDLHLERKFTNVQYRTIVASVDTVSYDNRLDARRSVLSGEDE